MIRHLSVVLSLSVSPALADVAVIDSSILAERKARDSRTTGIEQVDRDRSVSNQSVTCAMYRPARSNDPVAAANANPAIAGLVRRIAREEGVDENQFLALVYQESRFNPCARSAAGATGLAQLMPGTASELSVNPHHIEQNLRGGARYYRQQLTRFNGNVALALAAYNSGPGNVSKYGGIPPFRETRGYVANITQKWLPAFGGADKSAIPVNYGGGGAFESARKSTLSAMGLTAATADEMPLALSWLQQFGTLSTGTVQDSWDHNSGARNANLELINRLILLGNAFADLTNSRNALTLGDLSGTRQSTSYAIRDHHSGGAAECDPRRVAQGEHSARTCVPGFGHDEILRNSQ